MASSLLLWVVLCGYCCYKAHGADDHGFVVVQRRSYESDAVCSASQVNLESSSAAVSIPLVHRYGPCAPTRYSDAPTPSFSETLRHSRRRTNYIMSQAASKGMGMPPSTADDAAAVTIPTRLGGFVDSLEYVVTLGFGTPSVPQVLLIDTGSDVSWVQCAPCNSTKCYPQKDPLFDPSKSSTYAPVACGTDACRKLGDHYHNGCTASGGAGTAECGYSVEYADGSRTRGVYSNETLTLAPGITVEDFHFGCGHDQRGPNDRYDGLLGLGGAPVSLPVQTSSVYGGAFSYCLPALNNEAGFLALGTPPNTSAFVFTPMRHLPGWPTFYMVTLTGISVGGRPLDIPQSAFRGGMIIDSGTVVTELPETAYNALEAALRKAMKAYPLVPSDDFDTCYNFTGYSNVTVPRVALTFSGGATVDLDVPSGILVNDCLAFQESGPDDGLGIIGNVNQRTLEVLYDSGRGNVGFRAGAC